MTNMQSMIKKTIIWLILVALLSLLGTPMTKVYAATSYTQSLKSGISNFPAEYQTALNALKKLHPNWNFEAYNTGIPWSTLILNETATHGRNRVIKSSDASWKCTCGNIASGYACASEGIIAYYLDPRNFLNEINIFQFLEISYNSTIHTIAGVKNAVKGTFLDKEITYTITENNQKKTYTKHYADIILEAAKQSNMSPYSIVTKIIQEVGSKGSDSVSGTYSGYQGYYNFYNLGAYDTGNAIVNALKYAKDRDWNNQYKAIIEGAKDIANSYTNAGQNTAYFYKWDVVGTTVLKSGSSQKASSSNMFWHQYMTNVQDPTSQSKTLYNTYVKNKVLDANLNFIIPVYTSMPSTAVSLPSQLTTDDGDLYYVNCTDGLAVRETPSTSAKKLATLYKNTLVVMLERECATANGYKWDKVKLANGVTGYIASKYLTFKSASTAKTYKYKDNNIMVVPGTTLKNIDQSATGTLKTGAKIKVNGKEYTVVLLGDCNGDGQSSAGDYVLIKNHIMQTNKLTDTSKKAAADVNGDGNISAGDYVLIKNYIMKGTKFKL